MNVAEWLVAALAVAAVLAVLDGLWLSLVAKRFYRRELGVIMRVPFDALAAALFYVVYVAGVVGLAVQPSGRASEAALRSAALGAVAYATYDLTNRATIQPFSWRLVAVDITWGTAMTCLAGWLGFVIAVG
jgi:uncharacterized membrane protein